MAPRSLPRVAALALAVLSPQLPSDVLAQERRALRDTVLDNGLHVMVLPNHAVPVATVEVVVRAGAFTQVDRADEGLPHILEHMLFKTYGGRGWGYYASEAGASYNGTTSDERVNYFMTLPSERVERALELLGNLVRDPSFSRRDLEEEVLVVRGELERRASDPYFVLGLVHDMALWGPAFQRKNTIGNMSTILTAEPDRLRDHYRRFYVPNNAALIVSGDVDPDRIFAWAHERFRKWERGADPFADFEPPVITPLARDTAFVLDVLASDVTFQIGWHGPGVMEDPGATFAADVLAEMISIPTSGTQRRLVDSGAFLGVGLRYQTLRHVGPVTLSARTTTGSLGDALSALGAEFQRLSMPDFIDEELLAAAKKRILVREALAREDVAGAAHDLSYYWAVSGLDYYERYADGLQAVSADDVRAFLDRYVVGRPKVVSVLATEEIASALDGMLPEIVSGWDTSR